MRHADPNTESDCDSNRHGHAYSNCNLHTDCNCYLDTYRYCNLHTGCNCNLDAYCYCYLHSYRNGHGYCDRYSDGYPVHNGLLCGRHHR